jgi:hypothetical protein
MLAVLNPLIHQNMITKESILSTARKFENIILVVILLVFSLLLTLSLVDIVYEISKQPPPEEVALTTQPSKRG